MFTPYVLRGRALEVIPSEKFHVHQSVSMSKRSFGQLGITDDGRRYVLDSMRRAMEAYVAKARLEERETEHTYEFRLDLYVFNPDDFWHMVETVAYEMAMRMPQKG